MKKQCILRMAAGLAGLLLLLAAGGYLFRNALLNHVAGQRLDAAGQRYGLDIRYCRLTLEGFNTVALEGLSVVPHGRDTLLTLGSLQVRLSLWKLLQGDVRVRHLQLDSLAVRFVKRGAEANYDFLFLPSPASGASAPSGGSFLRSLDSDSDIGSCSERSGPRARSKRAGLCRIRALPHNRRLGAPT